MNEIKFIPITLSFCAIREREGECASNYNHVGVWSSISDSADFIEMMLCCDLSCALMLILYNYIDSVIFLCLQKCNIFLIYFYIRN